MHGDEPVAVEDAHQGAVLLGAQLAAEQCERDWIVRAVDFDMAIGMDRPRPAREDREGGRGERLQRWLLALEKVGPDLAARRAVDPQARDRAIPLPQMRILRVETVEPAALWRVVLDVPAGALLFAFCCGRRG